MTTPTLSELLSEKTKEDYFDELVQAAIEEKISTTAWQPGEPIRAVMVVVARILAKLWTAMAVPAIRSGFLDYASGAWLTLLAWTSYGVKRKGKTFAEFDCLVENRGASFLSIAEGKVRIRSASGATFTNISGTPLAAWLGAPNPYPTAPLRFRADVAGSLSSIPANSIQATPILAPTGVWAITNDNAAIASDEEPDDLLRKRCSLSAAPYSPAGPRQAYEFVAMSASGPTGESLNVTRVRLIDTAVAASVLVYLATPNGPADGSMLGPSDSSVFLIYQELLKSVVPAGITALVMPAATQTATVQFTVYVDYDSGLSESVAKSRVQEAISKYLSEVPIGGYRKTSIANWNDNGYVFGSELNAKASESAKGIVKVENNIGGSGDIVLLYNAVPDVTFTVLVSMVKQ